MIPSSPSSVDSLPTPDQTAATAGSKNSSDSCDGNNPTESNNRSLLTEESQSIEQKQQGVWSIFTSTFFTIFLAEMGDKTQLSTLLIAAESQWPWIVFAGAAIALIATSLLGVLVGYWLSNRLSPKTMERSAGILLLFISVMLLWDLVQMGD